MWLHKGPPETIGLFLEDFYRPVPVGDVSWAKCIFPVAGHGVTDLPQKVDGIVDVLEPCPMNRREKQHGYTVKDVRQDDAPGPARGISDTSGRLGPPDRQGGPLSEKKIKK